MFFYCLDQEIQPPIILATEAKETDKIFFFGTEPEAETEPEPEPEPEPKHECNPFEEDDKTFTDLRSNIILFDNLPLKDI